MHWLQILNHDPVGECMGTETSKFATQCQKSPLNFGIRKPVVLMTSTSLDDLGDVIADATRMLQFVQASQPL